MTLDHHKGEQIYFVKMVGSIKPAFVNKVWMKIKGIETMIGKTNPSRYRSGLFNGRVLCDLNERIDGMMMAM